MLAMVAAPEPTYYSEGSEIMQQGAQQMGGGPGGGQHSPQQVNGASSNSSSPSNTNLDMGQPPPQVPHHQFTPPPSMTPSGPPSAPPPPYCQPDYYPGDPYYPGPPPDYSCHPQTHHMCAVHGVPTGISGPASVRMVSTNSSPPIPLPVQVPPGHVVQQIVDETGTLRHVILSAQPVPMPLCPYGPNTGQGPHQFFGPPPPGPPPPQSYVPPHYQAPPQYPPVMSPPLAQPSPPPLYGQKSDRHNSRNQGGVGGGGGGGGGGGRGKFYSRPPHQVQSQQSKSGSSSLQSTPPLSPKKDLRKSVTGSGGGDGGGGEEETQEAVEEEIVEDPRASLHQQLSQIKPPKVVDVTPYEAMLQWTAPELKLREGGEGGDGNREVTYEVFLNNNSYMTQADTRLTINALKPATEYRVYLHCMCGGVRGDASSVTTFHTNSTIPDAPSLPRLMQKSKTSLQFKFVAVKDNGARITQFVLEMCSGNNNNSNGAKEWMEVFRGRGKQATINKLQPNTCYRVRLAAVNEHGISPFSNETSAYTSGVVPPQPAPPSQENATSNTITLAWIRRTSDNTFNLQMEDVGNGYGFLNVHNGPETIFTCKQLRRNTDYTFRLCAINDEGRSPFSDVVCYRTLAERPQPPSPPSVKGRPHSNKLNLTWTPPQDQGGSQVTSYRLEVDRGNGYECVFSGPTLEAECLDLTPGRTYRARVQCGSSGGMSEWSDVGMVTTEAVCPGVCSPPRLNGKPKASHLQLKWAGIEDDGGAQVTEYHIDMLAPDSDRRQVYAGRDLECTVASLLPGRPYIFLVRGVNRIGAGPWSEPFEVVSGAGPPDAPHAPHPATRGPHLVHLAWQEPINNGATIEQYTVQIAEVSCPHAESSESSSTCGDPETELTFTTAYTGPQTTTEIRALSPATTYAFRVCCNNSAGTGPWGPHATVTTPAAPPASPAYISSTPSATSITLLWGEPPCHGDPITHYIIEGADRTITTPGPDTEHTITDLHPETLYRIRIQGVNSVGAGPFSSVHKVTTRPLPPSPPTIELVKASHNCLKVRWGDGKNLDLLSYSLQMEFPNPHNGSKEFYQIYSGTSQSYKVVRLEENMEYRLRICASNEAGTGPYSPVACFSTIKAPPPPLKAAPRVTDNGEGGHVVEWCSVRCPGDDSIVYRLQLLHAAKDQDYSVVYTGSETSYCLTNLEPQSGYYVRVCGVRQCGDGETMAGAYSSPALFNTPKPAPTPATKTPQTSTQEMGLRWSQLTDQQKAAVILVAFSLFCTAAAIILHQFLAPENTR